MPETLLNVFEGFCDDLPETVRDDFLFMMVMLSDEDLVVDELDDIGERARTLFGARTLIGRIGNSSARCLFSTSTSPWTPTNVSVRTGHSRNVTGRKLTQPDLAFTAVMPTAHGPYCRRSKHGWSCVARL
jgi:hypothetical protein